MNENDNDTKCADPGVPNGGRSHPGNANYNDDGEGVEDTQGGENGTGKRKHRNDVMRNGKRKETEELKGTGHAKGNGNVTQTPRGDDISLPYALQLSKEMNEANSDKEC